MAPKIRPAGNTAELESLQNKLAEVTNLKDRILADKRNVEAKLAEVQAENMKLRKESEAAYEKIKSFEAGEKAKIPGGLPVGYVELASCSYNGKKPPNIIINGALCPRRIDEDGICYEVLPEKTAIDLLNERTGFKRFLIGPADKISGMVPNGIYPKRVEFFRHKKNRDERSGKWEFIRVYVEESK
jgi:hypothetical protein